MLDGGFVKKRLAEKVRSFPSLDSVIEFVGQSLDQEALARARLLRIYWYDADPFGEKRRNPIDGKRTNFATTPEAERNRALMRVLELETDVAVRRGELLFRGWRVHAAAMWELAKDPPRKLRTTDLEPVFMQKGVDMRIGLDIASLALKRLVNAVVLVTADADMVPAMKFVRREGLRVYLHTMGALDRRRELMVHADHVLG